MPVGEEVLSFVVAIYYVMFSFLTLITYSGRLSVERRCPFAIRSVPITSRVMGNRAIRVHLRVGPRKGFSKAICALECFRPSKGNDLGVRSKAMLGPGSHCLLGR